MKPGLQRRVQRYGWDKAAGSYERHWARPLAEAQMRLLELADLAPGDRVLDVACGTGLITFPAAVTVGSDGLVVGTDISSEMVEQLQREADRRGLVQVETGRMDAEDLRLPDDAFDVALCAFGLMYVPDPVAALKEMVRVLKPGGRLVVSVWGRRDCCGWAEIFPIVDARVSSEVCPLFFHLGNGDALERAMLAAGADGVVAERMSYPLPFSSPEDALGAVFGGGPVALAYSRFDSQTRDEVHEEYLASVAGYRSGDGYAIPGEFVLAQGRKAESA